VCASDSYDKKKEFPDMNELMELSKGELNAWRWFANKVMNELVELSKGELNAWRWFANKVMD